MNYEQNLYRKNLEAYRTMGTYYGSDKCVQMKGLESLAVTSNIPVVEGYDYGNCQIVVPTEASMNYNKVFLQNPKSVTYNSYGNVPTAYYPAQSSCGDYRLRKCN